MTQLVDWDLAAATAATLSRSGPRVSFDQAASAVADLRRFSDQAAIHVERLTGLRVPSDQPPVRVVDRADWAAINVAGLRKIATPLAERLIGGRAPGPLLTAVGSRVTGVQLGTVLAYLSGRVLGQFEVFSADPGQLLLVAQNIVEAERKLAADPRDFRLWVCLHEVAHRTQFAAVPWLRGHFLGEVDAFIAAAQLDGDQLLERLRRAIAALAESARHPERQVSLLDLVQTPAQRIVVNRLTALLTLLEGHAEYVMDGVGPTVVPSVAQIRDRLNRRRATAKPVDRLLRRLLGIEVKLRQYAEGLAFVHAVVDRVGMAGFNLVWQSPLTLPRPSELTDPEAWICRVLADPASPTRSGSSDPTGTE